MNAQVQPLAGNTSTPPVLGVALIAGRIVGQRAIKTQEGRLFLTLLKLAAPDEFTSPQTIEVRSREALGDKDTTWRGRVSIGGFGRSYDGKADPETGEIRSVRTAENRLTVVA